MFLLPVTENEVEKVVTVLKKKSSARIEIPNCIVNNVYNY